jgi:hypothetical protein
MLGYVTEVLEVKQSQAEGENRGAACSSIHYRDTVIVANAGHADNTIRILGSQLETGDDDWTVIADPITGSTDNLPISIFGSWARIRMETYVYVSGTPTARLSARWV